MPDSSAVVLSYCKAPTGDNSYSIKEAKKFRPNKQTPVTWYYVNVGDPNPINYGLYLIDPLTMCTDIRVLYSVIKYYAPHNNSASNKSVAYKEQSAMTLVNIKDWSSAENFSIHYSNISDANEKWSFQRLKNNTLVTFPNGSFIIQDNSSVFPQGIAPTSFNRASALAYSTTYDTAVLNGHTHGSIEGSDFSDAFTYFEHVDTADYSPKTPTDANDTSVDPSFTCIYIAKNANNSFAFEGCSPWTGQYNAYSNSTLVDASGRRSGFTNPGFRFTPTLSSLKLSTNANASFYQSYHISIHFGDTHFDASSQPIHSDMDFGIPAISGSSGKVVQNIQPVHFYNSTKKIASGIVEQFRTISATSKPRIMRGQALMPSSTIIQDFFYNQCEANNPHCKSD